MIKTSRGQWDRMLNGMRYGIFEVMWPTPWIKQVWVRSSTGRAHIFIHATELPNEKEREFCRHHVEMMIETGRKFDRALFRAGYTIRYSLRRVPRGMGYRTLMSDRLFQEIARKHAPWRLENGR